MKHLRNLLIGIVVSMVFLWLALRDVQLVQVQTTLLNARWEYIPLILAIWTFVLAVRAVRWYYLMDGRVSLWKTFHIQNIGFLINGTLPFRVGELARAYL